jgi:hypothetical protein
VVGGDQRSSEIEQIQVREAERDRGRMGKYFQGLSSFNRRERDMASARTFTSEVCGELMQRKSAHATVRATHEKSKGPPPRCQRC